MTGVAELLGLRPRPRDLAPWCQSRMEEGGIVPPHSVLAPGTALGSVPTVALPSAQVRGIVGAPEGAVEPDKTERSREEVSFGPVVRSELPCGNLRSLPWGPTRVGPWMRRLSSALVEAGQHVAVYGVALAVRNSHQIRPHRPGSVSGPSYSR